MTARSSSSRIDRQRRSKSRRQSAARILSNALENLEQRRMLAANWQTLSAGGSGPSNGQAMMLLSDGSVLVQGGNNASTTTMYHLTPQANTGSYVNGNWSTAGSLNEGRLFFTTATLPDGRIFAIGGEYPKFSNTAEIYNPLTDVWTPVDPIPTPATNVDLTGVVTGASNASPIVITVASNNTTAALKNGDSVTIAGVNGNTAANGTWTISNITSTGFTLNGSAGNGGFINDGNGTWAGPSTSQYGDDPISVLPNGDVLCGYFNGTTTYLFDPTKPSGSQWTTTAAGKVNGDASDEEAWVKLPDGSILSYDVFSSQSGVFHGQRFVPSMNKWVDASSLGSPAPSIMSDPATPIPGDTTKFIGEGSEMGPGFLLPDGRVFYFGANGNTAYYTPSTDKWTAGPKEPSQGTTQLAATDNPGAMLPNGDILIALSPLGFQPATSTGKPGGYNFPTPSYIYEYNPVAQTYTDVSPGGSIGGNSISANAYKLNMLVLPTGQVLLSDESGSFQVYTEDSTTGPQNAWRPVITNLVKNADGTFTVNGTQLNGISEGANYGDDNESATNYPLLRFTDSSGNVSYARTFNWSSTGVATDNTPISAQFVLPSGHTLLSDFKSVVVVANGIPSNAVNSTASPNVTSPGDQAAVEGATTTFKLGSFIDPDGSPWTVKVDWGDGVTDTFSVNSDGSLGTLDHIYAEEGKYITTVTVTDSTSLSGSAKFNVAVSDPAVNPSGVVVPSVEGIDPGFLPVATFTDPGGAEPAANYSATIDWGDGTTTTGVITQSGITYTVLGDHYYAEESATDHPGSNPYSITVTISHESATQAVAHSTGKVSDPAVTPIGGFQFTAVEGQPSATQTVATFTDPGGPEAIADYNATIDWGDGSTSTGTITQSGSTYTVTGAHTYATGLGLPDDFGNTFCDAAAPSYHKPITVSITHESAPAAKAVSDAKISLPPASAHLAGGSLIVVATTGNDDVQITPVGSTGAINVMLNNISLGNWTLGPGGRVIVAAMAGNDNIQVAGGVRANTVLYGGPGNDRIKGGAGHNIEVGCDGNDSLTGGNAGDLLIGGAGADNLNGGQGNEIFIAGINADASNMEDDKYSDLVNILNGGSVNALDDGVQDIIQGAASLDTAYVNVLGGGVFDILRGKGYTVIDI